MDGVEEESVSCNKGKHHPHTLILSKEGNIFSCGDGYKGSLGLGDTEGRNKPGCVNIGGFVEGSCGEAEAVASFLNKEDVNLFLSKGTNSRSKWGKGD